MKGKIWCPYCMSPIESGEVCHVCGLTEGSYTALPHHLPPGTVLRKRYLIGRVLGEGGFGITYIGCDLQLEVKLAIKEYFPVTLVSRNAAADLTVSRHVGTTDDSFEHDLERFLKEARAMAKLSKQRNIVTIHDFFRANGTAYIVMEYIDGTTFRDLAAQRGGKIPAWELLHLIEPLFSALQTMHEAGLIHRDVSPENIMLENGVVRLLDFGCARELDSDKTMTLSLKHGYAPAEQYMGKGQGPWTDVYALAATIYYCLTGIRPPQAMDRLMDDPLPLIPPRQLGADLTEMQERALLKALEVHPKQRYRSMLEFHAGLYEGIEPAPADTGKAAAVSVGMETQQPAAAGSGESPAGVETQAAEPASGNSRPAWIRNNKVPAGIAAALIAVVLIACIAVGLRAGSGSSTADTETEDASPAEPGTESGSTEPAGSESGGTGGRENGGSDDTGAGEEIPEAENTGEDTSPAYVLINGTAYVENGAESALRAALADDAAARVVVMGDEVELTEGILYVNKPLTLQTYVWTFDAVIVGEGGELVIDCADGGVSFNGLISTRDGGTITVNSGSSIYSDGGTYVLYLENWADLTLEDGASFDLTDNTDEDGSSLPAGTNGNMAFAIDEEALFTDAYEADSEDALRAAMVEASVSAITITADITLTEELTQTKPVRIAEGVTVTALHAEQAVSEDGNTLTASESGEAEQACCGWTVSGSVLINHGTLRGTVNTSDPDETTNSGDEPYVINDGTLLISGSMCRGGCLVNLEAGTLNFMYGDTSCNVVNLGSFLCASTVKGYSWLNLTDPGFIFMNSGTVLVETTEEQPAEQTIDFTVLSACFVNCSGGSLLLGENANAANYAEFTNHGSITLTDSSALLMNHRYLSLSAESTLDVRTGQFDNNGVVQSVSTASYLSSGEMEGHQVRGNARPGTGASENITRVDTAEELQAALDNESVYIIDFDEITWAGDLILSGKVLIGTSLSITDGDLFVTGSDTAVELSGVAMGGGNICLSDGATMLLHEYAGSASEVGTLEVYSGAMLMTTGGTELADMQIVIEGEENRISQVLRVAENVAFENCSVQVGAYGVLGGAETDESTRITVLSGGSIYFECPTYSLEGSLENSGTLLFYRDLTVSSTGSLTNYGELYLSSLVSISVEGLLDNQGTITADEGAAITADGGTVTGCETD